MHSTGAACCQICVSFPPAKQYLLQAREVDRLGVDVFGEMLKSRGCRRLLVKDGRLVGYEGHMTVDSPVFEGLEEL